MDISPGERQGLDIAAVHNAWIEIPSELGWSDKNENKQSRVFLQKKQYWGKVSILAANILRRDFQLMIDPKDLQHSVKVRPMTTTIGDRMSVMYRKTWGSWFEAVFGKPPLSR